MTYALAVENLTLEYLEHIEHKISEQKFYTTYLLIVVFNSGDANF